jgi:uncharacterized membrane protein
MRTRWVLALAVAGVVAFVGVLGGAVPGFNAPAALAQGAPQVAAQTAPAPSNPGYGPGRGYGPGFGPMRGPGFRPGAFGRGGRFRRGAGIAAGVFMLFGLLRFLLLVALLVIAWKVITLRQLWGRPDGAVQAVRERFARGEINEEEYRKRMAALS